MHGSCCGSSAVCKALRRLALVSNDEKPFGVSRVLRRTRSAATRRPPSSSRCRRPTPTTRSLRSNSPTAHGAFRCAPSREPTNRPALNTSGVPASVDASTARPARGPPGPSESIGACCDQLGRDEERDASDACQVRTHCLALPGCQEHCQSTVRVSVPSSVPSRRVDIFQSALHAPLSPLATGARAHAHPAPPPPTRMPVRGRPFSHSRACSSPCRPRRG